MIKPIQLHLSGRLFPGQWEAISGTVLTGVVHAAQFALLVGKLGLLAAGVSDRHPLARAQADEVGLELGSMRCTAYCRAFLAWRRGVDVPFPLEFQNCLCDFTDPV
jgi:hypothetical protein